MNNIISWSICCCSVATTPRWLKINELVLRWAYHFLITALAAGVPYGQEERIFDLDERRGPKAAPVSTRLQEHRTRQDIRGLLFIKTVKCSKCFYYHLLFPLSSILSESEKHLRSLYTPTKTFFMIHIPYFVLNSSFSDILVHLT